MSDILHMHPPQPLFTDRMLHLYMDAAVTPESRHVTYSMAAFDLLDFNNKSLDLDIIAPYNGMKYTPDVTLIHKTMVK